MGSRHIRQLEKIALGSQKGRSLLNEHVDASGDLYDSPNSSVPDSYGYYLDLDVEDTINARIAAGKIPVMLLDIGCGIEIIPPTVTQSRFDKQVATCLSRIIRILLYQC